VEKKGDSLTRMLLEYNSLTVIPVLQRERRGKGAMKQWAEKTQEYGRGFGNETRGGRSGKTRGIMYLFPGKGKGSRENTRNTWEGKPFSKEMKNQKYKYLGNDVCQSKAEKCSSDL